MEEAGTPSGYLLCHVKRSTKSHEAATSFVPAIGVICGSSLSQSKEARNQIRANQDTIGAETGLDT
jgi:hypothetical protein